MSFGTLLILALALAMDATAVAAAYGLAATEVRLRHVLLVGACFGGAQAVMPLLGWAVGHWVGPMVSRWDHWLAFALLAGIGAKMLWEARSHTGGERAPAPGPSYRLRPLLLLSLATSIDAFAAGLTLPLLGAPLAVSVLTIGVTTALLSGAALAVGRRLGARFGRRLDALGGIVLIALGVKILVQHLRSG